MVSRYLAHLRTLTVAEVAAAAHRDGLTFSALVARLDRHMVVVDEEALS